MMVKVGVIEKRAFLSVLQRIEIHEKTGLLTFIHNKQETELYFQQGQLTVISLKGSPSLGEKLVRAKIISKDNLQEALLILAAKDSRSLAPADHDDVSMARALIRFGLVSREQLNAWMTQEATMILHDLLTWSESEVSFTEGVETPTGRLPLNHRATSLISSLTKDDSIPRFSRKEPASIMRKLSLPASSVTPPAGIEMARPVTKVASNAKTPASALRHTPVPGMLKVSLPIRPLPGMRKTPAEASPVSKRDPHLEMFNTVSITALKAITHPKRMKNLKIRITGAIFVTIALFYVPWVFSALNKSVLWFSLPFLVATLYMTILLTIAIYNNWNRSVPKLFRLPEGVEPVVAILIPTYGEPVEMVHKTMESVLQQNWPNESMVIIVGDDAHKQEMQYMVESLQKKYPLARIIYHLPPPKSNPARIGKAKDGNLNSMLKFLSENYPDVVYVETRDADDLVGNANFLRYTVGHLVSNPKAAYVQTIKEAMVSPGDPFGNLQPTFYRGLMLSKHATNSVFPCGSGLVWSKRPLDLIGGFPTWNLVEDLYSGYVAMQHGFKGSYLPIVGAIGQVAPEDIPNVYKQLGTWALDAVRMFVWKNPWMVKGLTFQQRMHFTELGLFYLSSYVQLILFITPSICLFSGQTPLKTGNPMVFVFVLMMYTIIIDSFVLFLGHDITLKDHWRTRQLCIGMLFVYMKAAWLAIFYGPSKKPVYKVTRKDRIAGFYFKEVLCHILLFLFLLISIIYNFMHHNAIVKSMDFGSVFWALFYMVMLSGVISKSWYGVTFTELANKKNKHRTPAVYRK